MGRIVFVWQDVRGRNYATTGSGHLDIFGNINRKFCIEIVNSKVEDWLLRESREYAGDGDCISINFQWRSGEIINFYLDDEIPSTPTGRVIENLSEKFKELAEEIINIRK